MHRLLYDDDYRVEADRPEGEYDPRMTEEVTMKSTPTGEAFNHQAKALESLLITIERLEGQLRPVMNKAEEAESDSKLSEAPSSNSDFVNTINSNTERIALAERILVRITRKVEL